MTSTKAEAKKWWKMKKGLHLACGDDYKEGWINVDNDERIKADLSFDITKFPYPFPDNSFKEVYMKGTLYYLQNQTEILREMARVTKKGGTIKIRNPHGTSYACFTGADSYHTHVTENSYDEYFLTLLNLEKELKLINMEHIFVNRWKRFIPFKSYLKIFLIGIYDEIEHTFEVVK